MLKKVIISRTDSLGDVLLTLPLAAYLKGHLPNLQVFFVGRHYTKPLIESAQHVDGFIDREWVLDGTANLDAEAILFALPDKEVAIAAKKAGIKLRIGSAHRLVSWLYCNQRVWFSRKKSPLHEAQLNFKLLKPLGFNVLVPLNQIPFLYQLKPQEHHLSGKIADLNPNQFHLIIHPKSKGSAREWPMTAYEKLAALLPPDTYRIYITGTTEEGKLIRRERGEMFSFPHVQDLTGHFSLGEFIYFISRVDGLLACSTGPLHIAAALGKLALGLYPSKRPMHPGRWAPLGEKASFIEASQVPNAAPDSLLIEDISPQMVFEKLEGMRQAEKEI